MSKLLKYTKGFDNNPNSDIAASKRVVKQYKKLLSKETLQPIIQEMNNQTKSVVTNLNDYSLLLKNITQNLVNADLYLSNPLVSKSKGAGRLIGGMPPKVKAEKVNKGTGAKNTYLSKEGKNIDNKDEALAYIIKQGRNLPKGENFSIADMNLIKKFNLVPNIRTARKRETVLGKLGADIEGEEDEEDKDDHIPVLMAEVDPDEYARLEKSVKSPIKFGTSPNPLARNNANSVDRAARLSEASARLEKLYVNELDNKFEKGDRYSNNQASTQLANGLQRNDYAYLQEENAEESNDEEEEQEELNNNNYSSENSLKDPYLGINDNGNDDNGNDEEGYTEVGLDDIIKNRENTPIRENFIITLFSNIINQVYKASDFWETNITPNLSDIPRLKMDSFIKSNTVNNFQNAIQKFEDKAISGTIKTSLTYLDNIYHNLARALDELFDRMNIDMRRYAGGLSSSSSDKPQLMGAGYLPFRGSVYSFHLRDSNTKYLM